MVEAHEQGLVEQLVAHPTVARTRKAVLQSLATGDEMPVDPDLAAPRQHRIAGQLGAASRCATEPNLSPQPYKLGSHRLAQIRSSARRASRRKTATTRP